MNVHKIVLVVGIVIVLIVGYVFLVPHTKDVPVPAQKEERTPDVPPVSFHDVYKKGTHTLTGSVLATNACTVATAETSVTPAVASSTPATITIAISMPQDSGICLQVPTLQTFSVTAAAPSDAIITATINGTVASTTEK